MSPSRRTPTPRRSRARASRRPSIPPTSRCGTGSSRRCSSRSARSPLGAVLFAVTARGRGMRRMLPFTAADVYNGALRGRRPPVGAHDEFHPARIAAGLRRDDLRRLRRRRGHRAAGEPRVADAARRLSDPDAARRRADHDRRRPRRRARPQALHGRRAGLGHRPRDSCCCSPRAVPPTSRSPRS